MLRRRFINQKDNLDPNIITVTYTADQQITYDDGIIAYRKNTQGFNGKLKSLGEDHEFGTHDDGILKDVYFDFLGEDYNITTGTGHYYFYTSFPGIYSTSLCDMAYYDDGSFRSLDPIFSYSVAFWQYNDDNYQPVQTFKNEFLYKTISFSNNVEYLVGNTAFALLGSQGLIAKITLPASLQYIGDFVFTGVGNLKTITIPDRVHTIGEGAFSICPELVTVELGKNLKTIKANAFEGCSSLLNLLGGENVEYIGQDAFKDTPILSNTDKTTFLGTVLLAISNNEEILDIPNVTQMYDPVKRSGNTSVKEFNAPNIKNVAQYCFYNNTNLHSININAVQIIGEYAFRGCTALTEIVIPKSCIQIGKQAFAGCSGVKYFEFNAQQCEDFVLRSEPFSSLTTAEQLVIGSDVQYLPANLFKINTTYAVTQLIYKGTSEQWQTLVANSSSNWNRSKNITEVICSDGVILSLV